MAYDQTTPYMGAQYLSQGLRDASQSIGEGLQQYAKNKQADAIATGQIEAYLKQAMSSGTPLSDGTQKLADRFTSGKAGLNDKMSLLGSLQTDTTLKQQQLAMQQQQAQIDAAKQQQQLGAIQLGGAQQAQNQALTTGAQQNQLGAVQLAQAQNQQQKLAQLSQIGQYANSGGAGGQGGGQGVLTNDRQAQMQAGASDPMTNFMGRYANATGALPPAAAIGQYITRSMNVERPAGAVYTGPTLNPETQAPQFDNYIQVIKKGDGSVRYGEKVQVPYGSPAPAPVLDSATFQPVTKGAPAGFGADPKKLAAGLPKIITGPQSKALEGANADYQNAWANFQSAQSMLKAVQSYSTANPHGDRDNPIMGTDHGLKVRALLGDKSGYDLNAAAAKLTAAQFNDMKTGSGRLSQNEFNAIMKNIPNPENPNSTNLSNATQMVNMFKYRLDLAKAKKDLLATGLNEGEATAKANEQVPYPLSTEPTGTAPTAPTAATPAAVGGPMPTVKTADDYAKVVALGHHVPYRTPSGAIRFTP